MELIRLESISYQYKDKYHAVDALKDVSLNFEEGKVYALVGPSGSGKSTLLSIIAGFDVPTSGHVFYNDKDLAQVDRDWYRSNCVSFIHQSFNLLPLLTVIENVLYPLELTKVESRQANQTAVECLNAVGIGQDYHKRFPSTLSGGEQQRVAIARAVASNSRVVLADEPTGNLDIENSNNIINLLVKLSYEHNYCVIIVSHDLEIAQKADVILRMRGGMVEGEKQSKSELTPS